MLNKLRQNLLFKVIIKILIVVLVFIILYLSSAALGLMISHKKEFKGDKKYKIYIATGSIHADFILPTKSDLINWDDFIKLSDFKSFNSEPKYIQLGWGERDFYLKMRKMSNLTTKVALRAVLVPSPSLMHITYHSELPSTYYELKEVLLTKEQYETLINYLKSGFKFVKNAPILVPNQGYYNYPEMKDNFYEGQGSYHMFQTCNMWTTEGMYQSGIRASIFSPFKYGVAKFID